MKKIILAFCILMLTGCPYGQPYFYPLDVSIKDNMPCFSVPTKFFDRGDMKKVGVIISINEGDRMINYWASPSESTDIFPGQCVTYSEYNWQAGDYAVTMGVVSEKDGERYRLTKNFSVDIQSNGDRVIRDIN